MTKPIKINQDIASEIRKAARNIDHPAKSKSLMRAASSVEELDRPITKLTDQEILWIKGIGDQTLRRIKKILARMDIDPDTPSKFGMVTASSSYQEFLEKKIKTGQNKDCKWGFGNRPDNGPFICKRCPVEKDCFSKTEEGKS